MKIISFKKFKFTVPKKLQIVLSLFSFAVTQPLFDILNKNQEFFVASGWSGNEIIIFGFILAIIIPFLIYLVTFLLSKLNKVIGNLIYIFIIYTLFVLILMGISIKLELISDSQIVFVSLFLATILLLVLLRNTGLKKLIAFCSLSSLFFAALFFFQNKLITNEVKTLLSGGIGSEAVIRNPHPVVLILFDELPLNSLLDAEGNIDKVLFPNFASLLDNFTWYKNMTTVADSTTTAVPAIMTGSYPKKGSLSTSNFYPDNLFTYLKNDYKIVADEIYTALCPEGLCVSSSEKEKNNLLLGFSDILVIYRHLVLPGNFNANLPSIDSKWNNFDVDNSQNSTTATEEVRDKLFNSFLSNINETKIPIFYYHHLELPHIPYNFLPSGKLYRNSTGNLGLVESLWGEDQWLIEQNYQKHLLQAGFVDKLVGQLISKLKATNMFDKSVIIIASDHGVSFIPNEQRRNVTVTNYQDIMPVLFFMKQANQQNGKVSTETAETIDIIPTILDELGAENVPKFDGASLLADIKNKAEKTIYFYEAQDSMKVKETELRKRQLNFLKNKYTNNQKDKIDTDKIYKLGAYSELINLKTENFFAGAKSDKNVLINYDYLYNNIDTNSHFIPALISGYLSGNSNDLENVYLAISVNGVVRGTTKTNKLDTGEFFWSVTINEKYFIEGKNNVEIYEIKSNKEEIEFFQLNNSETDAFSLFYKDDKKWLKNDTLGKDIPIDSNNIAGAVDGISLDKGVLRVTGWGVDPLRQKEANKILIFVDNKFIGSEKPFGLRQDVVNATKVPSYLHSGFGFTLSLENTSEVPNVQIYVLSENDKAWELKLSQ